MALQLVVDSLDSVPEPVRAMYAEVDGKFRLQVEGVEDVKGLKTTLEKYKKSSAESAAKIADYESRYSGIDPDEFKTLKQQRDEAEELKLKAEGKSDELAQRKAEKAIAEERKLRTESDAKAETERKRADSFRDRVLDNHVRAAVSGKTHADAVEDALLFARQIFTLDETGAAVQLDADGEIVLGKDGKTPFSPAEWIEGMKEKKPHWFPLGSSGGGAPGNGNTTHNRDLSKLSPVERINAARQLRKT